MPGSLVGPRQPGIRRQHRRIVGREKRERRQHVTRPGNARDLGDDRPGVVELAQQQQIGARGLGGRVQQVVVGLAQHRKEKLAQPRLRALLHVVDHLHELGVRGVDVGPQLAKLQAQRLDLRPIDVRQRHHRRVAAALELQRDRNQWIDVSKSSNVRQNNAQSRLPQCLNEPQVLRVTHRPRRSARNSVARTTLIAARIAADAISSAVR